MHELIIAQAICFAVMTVLALILLMSRLFMRTISRSYETSRWALFMGMTLFAIHYLLQIHLGFRAQGEDVGALVNILFYVPSAYLVSFAFLRMSTNIHIVRHSVIAAGISYGLIIATFLTGWALYHSLHMQHAIYTMGGIFFISMVLDLLYTSKEIRRTRRKVENETGSDMAGYNIYMQTGAFMLLSMAVLLPIAIFSTTFVMVLGIPLLIALIFYVLSFIALGFNRTPVSNIIDNELDQETDDTKEGSSNDTTPLDEMSIERINLAIDIWMAKEGYADPDLSCATTAQRLGIRKEQFIQYLIKVKGETFRVWLSNIRVEKAKELLSEHEEYTIESIATECGFSSRSWLQQKFKASTGMTPNEWKQIQKNNKSL